MTMIFWIIIILFGVLIILLNLSIKIVRPTERGLVERLGKYHHYAISGFNLIIPIIDQMIKVNITEKLIEAQPQEIITKDKLNAQVDAQVYFKVKEDEDNVKASQYNVHDYELQIVQLARTTLRNIIGTMTLNSANSDRDSINSVLMNTLSKETKNWGIAVVRTELKEINPPQDVQATMNKVVKSENEKQAAVDYATATETEADGQRRARIKEAEGKRQSLILEAEGDKQSSILKAEGQSQAFKLINESFVGNAQLLKQFEVTENSLKNNTKVVLTEKGISPTLIMDALPIINKQ